MRNLKLKIQKIEKIEPFRSAFDGNSRRYLFNKDTLFEEKEYVPFNNTDKEIENGIKQINVDRIYKTVSFNKKQCFCVKSHVATPIVNRIEYTTSNKMERAITGEMIKETCIPIKVDRLGNINKIG